MNIKIVAIIVLAVVLHAMLPRYDFHVAAVPESESQSSVRCVIVFDRWTGKATQKVFGMSGDTSFR